MIQKTEAITVKLYDEDSECMTFDARVIGCEQREGGFAVELDRTAFFPEGGGQYADPGTLDGVKVEDVQIADGHIFHIVKEPFAVGKTVHGALDATERHSRMQNHSGEHIISGIVYRRFGYNNVGFHLGDHEVTMDFDGTLTPDDLRKIETEANEIVYRNVPVRAEYPSEEQLATMTYRSKLALQGNIRIVTIEGVDACACCAPHVKRTGEIGVIKIIDAIRYKGGMRLWILCGRWAREDYAARHDDMTELSHRFSVRRPDVVGAVDKAEAERSAALYALGNCKRELVSLKAAAALPDGQGNILFFEEETDAVTARNLANQGAARCPGVCAVFTVAGNGFRYVCVSGAVALRAFGKELNASCNGRGGGDDSMIQGTLGAPREQIERFFAAWKRQEE